MGALGCLVIWGVIGALGCSGYIRMWRVNKGVAGE